MRIAIATFAVAAAFVASAAHAADQTILGSSILVKNPGAPEARAVVIKAKEKASMNTLVGDPTIGGATLTVRMDGTGTPTANSYSLPQGTNLSGKHFWTGDSATGYHYRDMVGEHGPVTDVQIKRSSSGQFLLSAKLSGAHAPLAIVPLAPSSGACMFVEIAAGDSYSTLFSGGEIKTTATSFGQKKVSVEGSCAPSCTDGVLNQDETDVDCGGSCGACALGDSCIDGSDCTSGVCGGSVCVTNICGDGILQGPETCDDSNTNPCDGCSPTCRLESAMTGTAGPGLGAFIPDGLYNGTLASMTCVNVNVPAAGDSVVDYVCAKAGITHSFIGDLVVKLVSPLGTVVTLLNRPGFLETVDNGVENGTGDNSDLSSFSPITWIMGAPTSAESMGNTIGQFATVCQADGICQFAPNAGAAVAGDLDSFIGQNAPGTWKLCVGDVNAVDAGTIDKVQVVVGQ